MTGAGAARANPMDARRRGRFGGCTRWRFVLGEDMSHEADGGLDKLVKI
jgi:hypothetical protein